MRQEWKIQLTNLRAASRLSRELGLHPLTANLLANRSICGVAAAKRFIRPSLKDLPPPSLLKDIEKATARIVAAIEKKEAVLIFGDYDVDGVTATSLLYRFLDRAGARVSYYIPDRAAEGYGLKPNHITACALPRGARLLITVDCGSSSHAAILEARQYGIDVIVTDHHEVPEEPPQALAMINPKRKDGTGALRNLAGVGVAFYLIISLRTALRRKNHWCNQSEPNLKKLCDLVAMGTVADVVPMVNENRILTKTGLEVLQKKGNGGIRMLMEQCGINARHLDSMDIAFKLAPRLNAAGRVAHADAAMALLAADSPNDAAKRAGHLHALNRKRREMENEVLEEIDAHLARYPDKTRSNIMLLHGRGWHVGILGIVASRLVSRFMRPAVVLTCEGRVAKGSARGIPGVDLAGLLAACSSNLLSHGGHAMAAGLQLHVDNIEVFKNDLERTLQSMTASGVETPTLMIDGPLAFKDISRSLAHEMALLQPFGAENPEPLFVAENVRVTSSKSLSGGHRRMTLHQEGGPGYPAIHFNPPPHATALDFFGKIAYRVQINRWNGRESIQLAIEDVAR